jgi:hypothetical protein
MERVPGALLRRIQRRLAQFYGLPEAPDVLDFVRPVEDSERETLLVREAEDGVELALLLPARLLDRGDLRYDADTLLQALEGVSHFVYLAERARVSLPTTRLELELQAEVDKFVLLAIDGKRPSPRRKKRLLVRLFERVRFLHDAGSEDGDRYRLANALAARYLRRLERFPAQHELRAELRRFYRAGQTEKIRMAG